MVKTLNTTVKYLIFRVVLIPNLLSLRLTHLECNTSWDKNKRILTRSFSWFHWAFCNTWPHSKVVLMSLSWNCHCIFTPLAAPCIPWSPAWVRICKEGSISNLVKCQLLKLSMSNLLSDSLIEIKYCRAYLSLSILHGHPPNNLYTSWRLVTVWHAMWIEQYLRSLITCFLDNMLLTNYPRKCTFFH